MKKTISVLIVLLIILSMLPMVVAEETTEDDPQIEAYADSEEATVDDVEDDTQTEIETMATGIGAQVRLLQLEKAISRNILIGNEFIAKAEEAGKDVSALEAIIDEMEQLKLEVQALDPAADDAVQTFVDLKHDATDLSKEFRETAKGILTEEEIANIKQRLRQRINDALKTIQENIRNRIRAYNAERLRLIHRYLGMDSEEIADLIASGEMTIQQAKERITQRIRSMAQEEKRTRLAQLKQEGLLRSTLARAAVEKVRLNYLERKETRLTRRLTAISTINNVQRRDRVVNRITERIESLNVRQAVVQERIEQRIENRAEKIQAKSKGTGDTTEEGDTQ